MVCTIGKCSLILSYECHILIHKKKTTALLEDCSQIVTTAQDIPSQFTADAWSWTRQQEFRANGLISSPGPH